MMAGLPAAILADAFAVAVAGEVVDIDPLVVPLLGSAFASVGLGSP